MSELQTFLLRLPRNTEITAEASRTFLAALTNLNYVSTVDKWIFRKKPKTFALEIALVDQIIKFQLTADKSLVPFVSTQLQSSYPLVIIEKSEDPIQETHNPDVVSLTTTAGDYYPISTYDNFQDVDPLSPILTVLSKGEPEDKVLIQYALESAGTKWQAQGEKYATQGEKKEDGSYGARPDAAIIKEKIAFPGFKTSVRIIGNNQKMREELVNAFGVYTLPNGNSFTTLFPNRFNKRSLIQNILNRQVAGDQILNIKELATIWHLPSQKVKTPSIAWGKSVLSEAPENLPVAEGKSEEEKKDINFFAKTLYHNKESVFGIKEKDRWRHIWTVGKTGTGKSTMIANMAIDDLKKDRGVGIIDPHGDLAEVLLDYIPSHRINQTVYFNPADKDFPVSINPLEVTNREDAELVVSGLMSIFTKVWANVWSARMEYILRNTFMTLAETPNRTLEDTLKILTSQSFRNKILNKVDDKALNQFWKEEFEKMPPQLQKEAISPIQNKVGQFVTSPLIRRIIGSKTSSIQLDEVMNEGKILIANLSQGRLGEDNSALLGAMLITKFQLAAMHRVDIPEEDRIPFYLYVDEFQNFATDSFIKILSEARKYRLALFLANQYMAQIPEDVTKAILGNAGTLATFTSGAADAAILHKEFAEVFSENDLVNLDRFQIAIKLMIDGYTSRPFLANTLPLPDSSNKNREKVIRVSRERYTRKVKS